MLPWDTDVDYLQHAIARGGTVLYRATVATGPGSSNATDPTSSGQSVWAEVSGTQAAPNAPAAPQAVAPASGELDWFWDCPLDNGAKVASFRVRYRVAGLSAWSPSNTGVSVTTARYALTGLTNGTAIEAQVQAVNSVGSSPWSSTGSATPSGTVPGGGATLALRAVAGDAEVDLDWLEPDDGGVTITSYTVQWRTGNQGYSTGRQASVTATMRTVTSLTNGTEYFFRVRAVNGEGNGAWSNEDSAEPVAEVVVPVDPADTAPGTPATPDRDVIDFETILWSWSLPSSNGGQRISGYDFQWREDGDPWVSANIIAQTESCYLHENRSESTTYQGRARARNSVGNSSWSGVRSATTPAEPTDPVPPADTVPDTLDAPDRDVIDFETILWSWSLPDDDGGQSVTGYHIQWRIQGAGWSGNTIALTESCYLHENRSDSTTYEARVRARNSVGNSSWSSETAATTPAEPVEPTPPADTVPSAPDAPDRDVIDHETILWSWSFPDDDGGDPLTGYDIQWRESGDAWSGNIIERTESCYLLEGRAASTTYEARVRATNSVGDSSWSSGRTATTPSAPIGNTIPDVADAPTGTAVQGAILWTIDPPSDNGSDITGYQIRTREVGAGSWNTTVPLTLPVYNETGLTNGDDYEAQVRAINGIGTQTTWSDSGEATPAAEVPDQVQRVVLTNESTGIQANWGAPMANGAAVTGYTVHIDDNASFSSPSSAGPTGTSRLFTSLTEGTTYYVRARGGARPATAHGRRRLRWNGMTAALCRACRRH